jgi:NADH-ubiquinone oxidoreductase chain 2
MLSYGLIFLLLSCAISQRRDKSLLFSRITILILLYSILQSYSAFFFQEISKGISIYNGLFMIVPNTLYFHVFIYIISIVILTITGFYPRKIINTNLKANNSKLKTLNKTGEQYKILEYPLIILFIIIGSNLLISTNDIVSIFLSIELQSYGLYLLCTLYRNSESATSGGLTYFLLGGLSSCFILLGFSLLYANSGITNLDGLYIITSISEILNNSIIYNIY